MGYKNNAKFPYWFAESNLKVFGLKKNNILYLNRK